MSNSEHLATVMVNAFIDAVDRGVIWCRWWPTPPQRRNCPRLSKDSRRLVNVGIAEQTLVTPLPPVCAGGKVAVTCNAAPFLISRAMNRLRSTLLQQHQRQTVRAERGRQLRSTGQHPPQY